MSLLGGVQTVGEQLGAVLQHVVHVDHVAVRARGPGEDGLTGTCLMCRRVAGHMAERGGGSIVNIASETAHIMFADRTAYTATKAGVIGFTRALAIELAGRGVRANTVSPTVVMTEMGRTAWAGEKGEAFLRDIPLGRFAEVEDVAVAVLFLCSQGATMITATDLLVDGGNTAH